MPRDSSEIAIAETLADLSTSFWLRDALNAALGRDPVDAATDAAHLAVLLGRRADDILSSLPPNIPA